MTVQAAFQQIVSNSTASTGSTDRTCPICGRLIQAIDINIPGIGAKRIAPACKCETDLMRADEEEAKRRAEAGRIQTFSDDDQMVFGATFDKCVVDRGNQEAHGLVTDFARNVGEWGERGIYLHGSNGLGKSYFLSAATNYLRRNGYSVIYTTTKGIVNAIKTIREPMIEAYKAADVLVIDEMGAGLPADWEMEDLFNVINGRQGRRPILYGSNYSLKELEERVNARYHGKENEKMTEKGWGTRLLERIVAVSIPVLLSGESKRINDYHANRAWAKERLKANAGQPSAQRRG